ncbi:nucleotidyltransferase domain-containing protein [Candidatus Woesearchaeota archaeon]|nr:nucleotidyltransferase domain-containing protein [Candidatus Woesearchaeota archaeon]
MLIKSKDYLKIRNKLRDYLNEEIVDIFLFGSFVKGKEEPEDVDSCIVFRNKVDLELVNKIKETAGINLHVSMLTADNFFQKFHSLAQTVLFEGVSIIDDRILADKYNLKAALLYKYDISSMSQSKKTRFVRLLRGKNNLVQKLDGEFIAPGVFILPVKNDGKIMEFLDFWNIKYTKKKIFLIS